MEIIGFLLGCIWGINMHSYPRPYGLDPISHWASVGFDGVCWRSEFLKIPFESWNEPLTSVYITIMLFLSCYFEYHTCALITDLLMHHIELENSSVEINWDHVFSGCGFSAWFEFSPQSIRLFPSFVLLFVCFCSSFFHIQYLSSSLFLFGECQLAAPKLSFSLLSNLHSVLAIHCLTNLTSYLWPRNF